MLRIQARHWPDFNYRNQQTMSADNGCPDIVWWGNTVRVKWNPQKETPSLITFIQPNSGYIIQGTRCFADFVVQKVEGGEDGTSRAI